MWLAPSDLLAHAADLTLDLREPVQVVVLAGVVAGRAVRGAKRSNAALTGGLR